MSTLKLASALSLTLLAAPSLPASAATAHNSQAGAFGSTTNGCAPTPYFPAGGCISSAIEGALDGDEALPPPARYRARGPVRTDDE